jgi:hypothetical protein
MWKIHFSQPFGPLFTREHKEAVSPRGLTALIRKKTKVVIDREA